MQLRPTTLTPLLLFLLGTATHAHPGPAATGGVTSSSSRAALAKRANCGPGVGSCPAGQCCSEAGFCGTDVEYCKGPGCQIPFSGLNCDASKPPAGQSTENVPRPRVGNVPYDTIINTCTRPGLVALTFDDGPFGYTSTLLDILDETSTPATFFITGNSAGKGMISDPSTPWPGILRRMHATGHQLASHTWTHENLQLADNSLRKTQMIYNEMAFRDIFGFFPVYMRPPYAECYAGGSGCLEFITSLGYHVANFNIDTKDYAHDSPLQIQTSKDSFAAALAGGSDPARSSFIVLMHDTHEQTVHNLTRFAIDTLRSKGYKPVTLGECLDDPRANWYRDARGGTSTLPRSTTSTSNAGTTPTGVITSRDGTCGGTTGFTCDGASQGSCCSPYGFCGSTSAYCDGGCQGEYGSCNNRTGTVVSANGKCGFDVDQTCSGSTFGECCSIHGFCGATAEYCGTGCQGGYGRCG